MRKLDLCGHRYGALLVASEAPAVDNKVRWLCKCVCGADTTVRTTDLRSGKTKSCGCRLGAKRKSPLNPEARARLDALKVEKRAALLAAKSNIRWSDHFTYEAGTGRLLWKVKRPGPQTQKGAEAGSVKHDGRYRTFVIYHKRFLTHRVIWELVNGPIPEGMCIDHIDGNGLNNRLENLRVVTLSINQRNRQIGKNNRTGVTGVFHHSNGRGFVVHCAGKYVGYFTKMATAAATRKAVEAVNGFTYNPGRTHK